VVTILLKIPSVDDAITCANLNAILVFEVFWNVYSRSCIEVLWRSHCNPAKRVAYPYRDEILRDRVAKPDARIESRRYDIYHLVIHGDFDRDIRISLQKAGEVFREKKSGTVTQHVQSQSTGRAITMVIQRGQRSTYLGKPNS